MKKVSIPFQQVSQLSKTDIAYTTGDPLLSPFYAHQPTLKSFSDIIEERKGKNYPRKDLVEVLRGQYKPLVLKPAVIENIEALIAENTFTIVTAHQPSFLFGPLYFIYKALSTVNLAKAVEKETGSANRIIPVYVIGAEDHDLEEVNHAKIFGKQLVWEPGENGPVGSMQASSTLSVLEELKSMLGEKEDAKQLYDRILHAYSGKETFAEATQALIHEFLGDTGLVVLNMNTPALKRHFAGILQHELLEQDSSKIVNESIEKLNEVGFKTQATPREINVFYMKPGLRERIIFENGQYKVLNTDLEFTQESILQELEEHPEHFSPNVIMRPLYQEIILPNLAYVGGGGELAYWLERKTQFEHFGIPYPMLVRRHSVLWLDKDVTKKMEKLGLTEQNLFEDTDALIRNYLEKNTEGDLSLAEEIQALKNLYKQIGSKAGAIDPTLETAVEAESVKAVSGFEHWENRLLRAEKQKHETAINQIRNLKDRLFPENGLQERVENIIPLLLKYGDKFLLDLLDALEPLETEFIVLQPDPE